MADYVTFTPYSLHASNVALFVQLSPMTATCAATVPFLASRTCATASVVYDFIPTDFPRAYLDSATSALTNRARIEALRHYDLLLPISRSTEAACRRILGEAQVTSVTGVGAPLPVVTRTRSSAMGRTCSFPLAAIRERTLESRLQPLLTTVSSGEVRCGSSSRGDSPPRRLPPSPISPAELDSLMMPFELRGYVGEEELSGLYHDAELVFVGAYAEGFSIPVAEAVAHGTPVVASDIPAHRELVGVGPWLASAAEVDGLADAIGQVRRDKAAVVEQQRRAR